jgi:hypothetical protein
MSASNTRSKTAVAPMLSPSLEVSLNPKQLDHLVEDIFARVIDLAKDQKLYLNQAKNEYEVETLDLDELSQEVDKKQYAASSIRVDDYLKLDDDFKFDIFNNTCPVCFKTYEQAKFLVAHFNDQHVISKQAYECTVCGSYHRLDDYLKHLLADERHLNRFILKDMFTFYRLFLVKLIQDVIVSYYTNSSSQGVAAFSIFKYRNAKNSSLIDNLNSKINESFFNRHHKTCKSSMIITAKSIKSNQLCTKITQSDLLNDSFKYLQYDYKLPDNEILYLQCNLCYGLLNDFNDMKMHIIKVHTNNEKFNKCLSCCYCRQLLKTNNLELSALDLFNSHISRGECFSLKTGKMPLVNLKLFSSSSSNGTSVSTPVPATTEVKQQQQPNVVVVVDAEKNANRSLTVENSSSERGNVKTKENYVNLYDDEDSITSDLFDEDENEELEEFPVAKKSKTTGDGHLVELSNN